MTQTDQSSSQQVREQQENPKSIVRVRAMNLLARREHSCFELQRKLGDKFPDYSEIIGQVVLGLQKENLQSDERFAEAFLSSRIRRGQGPNRISMELQQRGVDQDLIGHILEKSGIDWYELARAVLNKKYGTKFCEDFKERARRSSFLHYRGFNSDQIAKCFNSSCPDND
ncbi:MAG: regulatory protein RecX [Porticoccus sp.]|nr:regulatory protein RecX [Porticoccus sp.]